MISAMLIATRARCSEAGSGWSPDRVSLRELVTPADLLFDSTGTLDLLNVGNPVLQFDSSGAFVSTLVHCSQASGLFSGRRVLLFWMSLLIAGVIAYGCAQTIDSNLVHATPRRTSVFYVDAVVFSAWILFVRCAINADPLWVKIAQQILS